MTFLVFKSRTFGGNLLNNKESSRGIGPRRFSPSPGGVKYSTVTQDMSSSGVNF